MGPAGPQGPKGDPGDGASITRAAVYTASATTSNAIGGDFVAVATCADPSDVLLSGTCTTGLGMSVLGVAYLQEGQTPNPQAFRCTARAGNPVPNASQFVTAFARCLVVQ